MVRKTWSAPSRLAWEMSARLRSANFKRPKSSSRQASKPKASCSRRFKASAWGRADADGVSNSRRLSRQRQLEMIRKAAATAKTKTFDGYLAALPPDKRAALEQVRQVVRAAAP